MLISPCCLLDFDNLALGISMRSAEEKKGQWKLLYFDTKGCTKATGSFCWVTWSLHQESITSSPFLTKPFLHYLHHGHSSKHFSKHFKNPIVSTHKYSAARKWWLNAHKCCHSLTTLEQENHERTLFERRVLELKQLDMRLYPNCPGLVPSRLPATVSVRWWALTTWWMSPCEKLLPVSQTQRCPGYEWTSQWGRTWKAVGHNFLVLWRRLVGCLIVTLLTGEDASLYLGLPPPPHSTPVSPLSKLTYHTWVLSHYWVLAFSITSNLPSLAPCLLCEADAAQREKSNKMLIFCL